MKNTFSAGLRGDDSFGEPGPVKTGDLDKMGEICPWTIFAGGNRFESADGRFSEVLGEMIGEMGVFANSWKRKFFSQIPLGVLLGVVFGWMGWI